MRFLFNVIRLTITAIITLILISALFFFVLYQMGIIDRYIPRLACVINGGHKTPEIKDLGNNQIAKIVYKRDCTCDTILYQPAPENPQKP